ncbi:hypothetical protein F4553_004334 [Allocatelliglobosispora scoriae]|uniref:TadE-like domain-containing protein n=1 Tax=Allocatelliglobosispora scoriae TaxID=643052 RepID=A0A841BTC8_9ACTN|nr:TadE family protein [Allocatelliglobosispora scoriae]MBB5870955.1 hypothetical protein [Allocatelliglobosispora scoriae]
MKRRSRTGDRGAAAAEFALVLPLLLLLVFGIIDFGRMINQQLTLTEGAREGSRLAVVVPGSSDSAIEARVRLVAADAHVVGPVTSCRNAAAGAQVTVTATKTFEFATPVGVFAAFFGAGGVGGNFTMTGEGVGTCRS